jgi:hypothetical protein
MKKALYLGFCLVLAMGVGCAITNYSLITDNDQVSNGQGSGVVNTNGKAKLIPSAQIATIWSDGTDELFSMVDQKANGDRTITTYNNFSTGGDPTFSDDLYCNPDWQGCAIVTAPDPEVGDADIFDGSANANCLGFRSLSVSLSTSRYYGECGRARLDLSDRLSLANMGRLATVNGKEGLLYDLNRNNFSMIVDNNAGVATALPITGDYSVFFSTMGRGQMLVDLTNPLGANVGRAFSDFLRTYGTSETDVTITYNGISTTFEVGGDRLNASNVLGFVNRKF